MNKKFRLQVPSTHLKYMYIYTHIYKYIYEYICRFVSRVFLGLFLTHLIMTLDYWDEYIK